MQGQLTLRAMSLVYTTLLSLVPLLALSFSMLKAFGIHNQLEPLLLKFLAPLGEQGTELATQIVQFVENIGVGVLGSLGLLLLVYTVVSLIQKVEASLNFIWHVNSVRNLSQRLSGYLSVVMVGPLLVVTALGITASTMNTGLVQQIVAIEPFGSLVIGLTKLVPYILVIGAFSATYILIPHTNVKWRSALLGGLIAGVLWETVGWGFASFIVGSAKYEAVYSGFAILILFLFWLYLNWLVLLLGASIAFYHQNPAYQASGTIHKPLGNRAKELLALEILRLIGKAYQDGDRKWTLENLLEDISLPMESVNEILQKLLSRKLLVNAGDADTAVACRQSSPTRLIRNEFWEEMNALDAPGKGPMEFMKLQGEGMARIPNDPDGSKGNYTAGTGAGLIRKIVTADEVVREIMGEAESGLSRMNSLAS